MHSKLQNLWEFVKILLFISILYEILSKLSDLLPLPKYVICSDENKIGGHFTDSSFTNNEEFEPQPNKINKNDINR